MTFPSPKRPGIADGVIGNEKAVMLPVANCRWFAGRHENGRETGLANLVVKMLFLKDRCSPVGIANQ
jgi:hypothetical protein